MTTTNKLSCQTLRNKLTQLGYSDLENDGVSFLGLNGTLVTIEDGKVTVEDAIDCGGMVTFEGEVPMGLILYTLTSMK